jgi:hypothetical protein
VRHEVRVTLLKAVVLPDVVQVVAAHRDGLLHLGRVHDPTKDAPTDRNVTSERALLVNIATKRKGVLKLFFLFKNITFNFALTCR